jgi:lactoylglutathione lyase
MIAHVTVHTAKLDETIQFYQWLLGLPISMELEPPTGRIVFLGNDETKLELIGDPRAGQVDAPTLSLGFAVENLEEKLALLDSRQIPHSKVINPQPQTRFAFFNDLNGCCIQLFERA